MSHMDFIELGRAREMAMSNFVDVEPYSLSISLILWFSYMSLMLPLCVHVCVLKADCHLGLVVSNLVSDRLITRHAQVNHESDN